MQVAQDHTMASTITVVALTIALFTYAWWLIKGHRWYLKVRRRRGGIYLVRTQRHHLRPRWLSWLGMRENGYVGLTVSYYLRQKDHLGTGRHGAKAKDWSDLKPVWHKIIPLPWWLCWHWLMNPLETLAIRVLAPRYNIDKNKWNPRRITPNVAKSQRLERDRIRSVWGPPPSQRIDHG